MSAYQTTSSAPARMLHVIVGHKLPAYFLNSIRSVRASAPDDDLLVVDNASGLSALQARLSELSVADPKMHLLSRSSNDVSRNSKVGGLYDAYREAVAYAFEHGYGLLHIMQADMQMLWWDDSIVAKALGLFERYPECVNIHMTAIPRDRRLSEQVSIVEGPLVELPGYGLSDTGLYHLGRWRENEVRFLDSEQAHARHYRRGGLKVLCHPWPAVAQIPWPAVVRNAQVRGREVTPRHPLLLRPLSAEEVAAVKRSREPVWLEDVCIPWGWVCLTPMWPSALESIDYWVCRYRDFRQRGWRAAWPRWERRGVERGLRRPQRRPSMWEVLLMPPWFELRRRFAQLLAR